MGNLCTGGSKHSSNCATLCNCQLFRARSMTGISSCMNSCRLFGGFLFCGKLHRFELSWVWLVGLVQIFPHHWHIFWVGFPSLRFRCCRSFRFLPQYSAKLLLFWTLRWADPLSRLITNVNLWSYSMLYFLQTTRPLWNLCT